MIGVVEILGAGATGVMGIEEVEGVIEEEVSGGKCEESE